MYQPFPGGVAPPGSFTPTVPPSITRAVRVMYLGALASLVGIAVDAASFSSLKASLATRTTKNGKLMTPSQVADIAHVALIAFIVVGLIAAGLWIWMARSNRAGKSWARITSTVFFAIATIDAFVGLRGGTLAAGDSTRIYGFVVWIIGLAAIILLWQPASSNYFKSAPPY
jgi:hypothetical protein